MLGSIPVGCQQVADADVEDLRQKERPGPHAGPDSQKQFLTPPVTLRTETATQLPHSVRIRGMPVASGDDSDIGLEKLRSRVVHARHPDTRVSKCTISRTAVTQSRNVRDVGAAEP